MGLSAAWTFKINIFGLVGCLDIPESILMGLSAAWTFKINIIGLVGCLDMKASISTGLSAAWACHSQYWWPCQLHGHATAITNGHVSCMGHATANTDGHVSCLGMPQPILMGMPAAWVCHSQYWWACQLHGHATTNTDGHVSCMGMPQPILMGMPAAWAMPQPILMGMSAAWACHNQYWWACQLHGPCHSQYRWACQLHGHATTIFIGLVSCMSTTNITGHVSCMGHTTANNDGLVSCVCMPHSALRGLSSVRQTDRQTGWRTEPNRTVVVLREWENASGLGAQHRLTKSPSTNFLILHIFLTTVYAGNHVIRNFLWTMMKMFLCNDRNQIDVREISIPQI